MICNQFDVVEVPFPFIDDLKISKKRKALVVSQEEFNTKNGATILCMITSATNSEWLGDIIIHNLKQAGLSKHCVIRFKLFTLQNNLILNICGHLSKADQDNYIKEKKLHM